MDPASHRVAHRGLLIGICLVQVALFDLAAAEPSRSVPASTSPAATETRTPVRLVFVGDIMLDTLPGEVIAEGRDPFAAFADVLADADLAIGNLECVIATVGEKVSKPYNFRAHPRCLPFVGKHFDALSLANNHTGDFGPEALVECLTLLKQRGMPAFGAGRNLVEAHQPWIVECRGVRLALLGYNEFKPREFQAGNDRAGVAWSEDERVLDDIRVARDVHHADVIIPFMHWGWEEEGDPNDRQRQFARMMVEAGASMVIGGHPHVTQGAEYHRGRLIVYSLGNFVFDGFDTPETNTGWALRLRLDKDGVIGWDTVVARIDREGLPSPAWDAMSPGDPDGIGTIDMRRAQPPENVSRR
ncbi:MAG: CapA family protein [Planctomycetaceae bacterium]